MLNALSRIVFEHDPFFVALAALVCVVGSVLAVRLFGRVRRTDEFVRHLWLFLAGLIGGATVWSVHFLAMLGYRSPAIVGYEIYPTLASFLVAVTLTATGFMLAARTARSLLIEVGGLVIGLGIAAMHYVGISGLIIDGEIVWNAPYVVASILFAGGFGIVATNRVARPVTRFCRYGGALALVAAIVLLHFTGMTALTILPGPVGEIPVDTISEPLLAAAVLFVMLVLIATTVAAYQIDLANYRQSSARYRDLALHDPLTGLPNRAHLESRLESTIHEQIDGIGQVALIVLDLDRFKEINDVHGHAAGDAVLRRFAERVTDRLGADEFLARFGGDEFVALKHPVYSVAEADAFCARLMEAASEPLVWESRTLAATCSIGLAVYPDDSKTPATLLEQADRAMYRSKEAGRNRISRYDPAMDEAIRDRSALAMDLNHAVKHNQLEVHFQPQNDTRTRSVIGYEALLRWNHPERGMVPPNVFIPIAEETGLIWGLGEWVLREACRAATDWPDDIKVAVNVASAQLASVDFPQLVHRILLETGLPPRRLELEITETGIIRDAAHALMVLRQLKALGVSIAMDDYGTGYSSLSTLQNFPFDKIKIDRDFIKDIGRNRQSAAIVRATIILGSSLGIPVLAEGVESEEHLSFLDEEGCTYVQGFLFGKPQPARFVGAERSAVEAGDDEAATDRDAGAAAGETPRLRAVG